MYKSGDLNVSEPLGPVDEFGYAEGGVVDSRGDYSKITATYLNHSCGDWVIGGIEEIDALIGDLQAARAELVARTQPENEP